jgi:hypothetical protein
VFSTNIYIFKLSFSLQVEGAGPELNKTELERFVKKTFSVTLL